MNIHDASSWGNTIASTPANVVDVTTSNGIEVIHSTKPPVLPFGMGRSYGDVCLNNGGTLLRTHQMQRILNFDSHTGRIRVESGIEISAVLRSVVPHGWFIPVIPGTSQITIGGAVANDVHGKNHHARGTFGCHVLSFELLRSDGSRTVCSRTEHSELFSATIGGMGLTGLITWVEFQLMPVRSSRIEVQSTACTSWADLFRVLDCEDKEWEYTVAWVDAKRGRGHVLAGKHFNDNNLASRKSLSLPIAPVLKMFLADATVDWFNQLKFSTQRTGIRKHSQHYTSYFHPLDAIPKWNRLYGSDGFFQYQFVVPSERRSEVIAEVMKIILASGTIPYLSVLKNFGSIHSPGLLSFPMPGITLAIDLPNTGSKLLTALEACDEIVVSAGGRIYPAKDARMSHTTFVQMFKPSLRNFTQHIDPHFSSSFWRRVGAGA